MRMRSRRQRRRPTSSSSRSRHRPTTSSMRNKAGMHQHARAHGGAHGDTTPGVHTGLRVHPRVHRETHSGPARGPAWGSGLRGTCVCVDVAVRRCVCVVVCVRVRVQHLFQWGAVGQAERPSSVGCKSALVLMSSLKEAQIPVGANQDGCTQFAVVE
jgi:hypothetical protein